MDKQENDLSFNREFGFGDYILAETKRDFFLVYQRNAASIDGKLLIGFVDKLFTEPKFSTNKPMRIDKLRIFLTQFERCLDKVRKFYGYRD